MAFPEKNYVLGRGQVFFGKFAADTRVLEGGTEYLGNTPEFNLSSESESLDHFDSDNGVRVKDDSVLLELTRSGSFITDHISPTNLARWFLGTSEVVTQALATSVVYAIANVKRGQRYQIGETTSAINGVRGLTSATVSRTDGGPTPMVEGVDFSLDLDTGGITILTTSTVILEADDGTADIEVTYNAAATSYHRVISGSSDVIEGRIFFKATNPKGLKFDYLMPYVQLRPDGDFQLKGDEWQQLSFTFEALKLDDSTEVIYTNGRAGVAV